MPQIASGGSWPAQAVRDTVAAIARQDPYQRSFASTLWQRLGRTLWRWIGEFLDLFRDLPAGRWVTSALVVLLLVLVAARVVLVALASRRLADSRAGPAGARSLDALAEAQRLAAAGRFTEAAHALLAAILSSLAARGEVRLHESKTTGDYARELDRGGSPRRSAFRAFRRRYDRLIYGVGECSADDFALLQRDAEPALA